MRPIHLLILFAFVLLSTSAASASDRPRQVSESIALLRMPTNALSPGLNMRVDLYRMPSNFPNLEIRQRERRTIARDPNWDSTCYTMRSYHIVRDEPGSDSTHVDRYTACQPGSQFEVRDLDLTVGSEER
jgi:hypothetical protein